MAIILARHNRPAMRLERTVIQEESYLQRYIHEHPDTLPLDQLEADARPLVLVREFPTASGPIDALAVDQFGNIYLIETKLYKNPDKRLVLAQVLDYGAALWEGFPNPGEFIQKLDSLTREHIGIGLTERLSQFYALDADMATALLDNLKTTITEGRFRFVVLVDTVEDRLKKLITYVNANSKFDVLGVALDFYQHEDIDILIPTLHGAEVKKTFDSPTSTRRMWNEENFLADAAVRISGQHLEALKLLYTWAKAKADEISFGPGAVGSINPKFAAICSRSVFTARSDGTLRLNFGWLNEPDSARQWSQQFAQSLREHGFSVTPDLDNRWPSLPAGEWVPRVADFIRILEKVVENARSVGATQT